LAALSGQERFDKQFFADVQETCGDEHRKSISVRNYRCSFMSCGVVMIIVKLMGGLGNQMFQYAAGRRIAYLNDVPLKLDLSWFEGDFTDVTPRTFALSPFAIHAEIATENEVASLYEAPAGRIKSLIKSISGGKRRHILSQGNHFDPTILGLFDNVLLDGYWQSEKYFIDIAAVIRNEFTLCNEPREENREIMSVLLRENSVSIHIRRGDYVADARTASRHGTCSDTYYRDAVKLIAEQVDDPHYFVFSDDPEWVQTQFKIPFSMTQLNINGPDQAYEDLRLMSLCRHHIIANSSFSWWGAWLDPRVDKMVIAPSRWFNSPAIATNDLIPESWLRIAS
jgi:hypothetical protein